MSATAPTTPEPKPDWLIKQEQKERELAQTSHQEEEPEQQQSNTPTPTPPPPSGTAISQATGGGTGQSFDGVYDISTGTLTVTSVTGAFLGAIDLPFNFIDSAGTPQTINDLSQISLASGAGGNIRQYIGGGNSTIDLNPGNTYSYNHKGTGDPLDSGSGYTGYSPGSGSITLTGGSNGNVIIDTSNGNVTSAP